jgi:hypothetical protein
MEREQPFQNEMQPPMNIADVSGSISFLLHPQRKGFMCLTYNSFFEEPFVMFDDKTNGRIIFKRPILSDRKVKKATKEFNRFSFWAGFLEDLSAGTYSDFEIENESLFLYYR